MKSLLMIMILGLGLTANAIEVHFETLGQRPKAFEKNINEKLFEVRVLKAKSKFEAIEKLETSCFELIQANNYKYSDLDLLNVEEGEANEYLAIGICSIEN